MTLTLAKIEVKDQLLQKMGWKQTDTIIILIIINRFV